MKRSLDVASQGICVDTIPNCRSEFLSQCVEVKVPSALRVDRQGAGRWRPHTVSSDCYLKSQTALLVYPNVPYKNYHVRMP